MNVIVSKSKAYGNKALKDFTTLGNKKIEEDI
jgi:hypothetical protein